MTPYEIARIKLECAKIAMDNGAKQGITKDACLDIARKIYCFVIGKDEKVPEKQGTPG